MKHRALAVVGDALECVDELDAALGAWTAPAGHLPRAKALFAEWDVLLDDHQMPTNAPVPTYAQVVNVVNLAAGAHDTLIAAATVAMPSSAACSSSRACRGSTTC